MNKIQYSDLYKFITSIGLILIAASFAVPWLFLKQDVDLNITRLQYVNLIESSKALVSSKNQLHAFFLCAIPIISPILFIVGVFLCVIGLKRWKKKQDNADTKEEYELILLKHEIKGLEPSEVISKAKEEIKQELQVIQEEKVEAKEKQDAILDSKNEPVLDDQAKEILSNKLITMENLFFQKIVKYNSFNYKPYQNIKLTTDSGEVDVFLHSFHNGKYPDKLIEIKYLQNKLSIEIVRVAIRKLVKMRNSYTSAFQRQSNLILIVIYDIKIASTEEVDRFVRAIQELRKERQLFNVILYTLNSNEADTFDIKNIVE